VLECNPKEGLIVVATEGFLVFLDLLTDWIWVLRSLNKVSCYF